MSAPAIDRRRFLGSAAATAAFFAMHDLIASEQAPIPSEPRRPRLLSFELLTAAPMPDMKAFYGKTLDLRLLDERSDRFTVEAGETRLTFISSTDIDTGRPPFYHFAFNIPERKIVQALEWQKARTPMLLIPESSRAAGYPPEVVEFPRWNAHAIFFRDPGGNVVEYIARHDMKDSDTSPFSWADILYASEIGLIVDDVPAAADTLKKAASLSQYKDASDQFTALGDEYGLLLLMKRGRILDFSSNPDSGGRVYRTGVNVRGAKAATHRLTPHPYVITIEERCSCA